MTVKKLFIISIAVLASAILITTITSSPYNRFTHACVQNHDQWAFETLNKVLGPDPNEPDQKQRFCTANHHPKLSEKWETINRYILYTAYAITIPVMLCCGAVLNDRRMRRRIYNR